MKILITGATAFMGEHLVSHLLEDGHEIGAFGLEPQGLDPLKRLRVEISHARHHR